MSTPILVTGVVPTNVYRFCLERGLAHAEVLGELSIPWAPSAKRGAMPYRDVVTIFERLAARDQLAAFAEFYVSRIPIVAMVVSYAVTTAGLYRLAGFTWTKIWPWRVTVTRDDDVLRIDLAVEDRAGPSLAMMELVEQVLPRLPTGFRRPPRRLDVIDKTPMHATFDVLLDAEAPAQEPSSELIFDEVRSALASFDATARMSEEWGLTKAETRVVQLLADGNNAKLIARQLGVSHETVRTLLKRAMSKARVGSQLELVAKLRR